MNTKFLLMAEFETGEIPLDRIAEKYFGLSSKVAADRATRCDLPVPAYRAGSQKSAWLVHVDDLANLIDERRAQARRDWEAMQEARE